MTLSLPLLTQEKRKGAGDIEDSARVLYIGKCVLDELKTVEEQSPSR